MNPGERSVAEYLERLRDLLPTKRADEVVAEVGALIEDRLQEAGDGAKSPADVARALESLGPPETLAANVAGGAISIDVGTRRAFTRTLAATFSAHLLLSAVLSVVGGSAPFVPGLVGPLPMSSLAATAAGVLGVFFVDVGVLVVVFALLGRRRTTTLLPRLRLRMPGTRRDAALSLVLLALVALLLHPFRDALLAVGVPESRQPILSPSAVALLPVADAMLALFGLRHLLLLVQGGERRAGVLADALGSLAGAVLAVLVMTREDLVRLPAPPLTEDQARTLGDLLFRVFLVVAFVAGVGLAIRFAKRVLRLRELFAG